jgi:hypothetical protein
MAGSGSCPESIYKGFAWNNEETVDSVRLVNSYKVLGKESVHVPAGDYTAMKIEFSSIAQETPGRTLYWRTRHCEYWFVPEVKAMVKESCEFLGDDGGSIKKFTNLLRRYDGEHGVK